MDLLDNHLEYGVTMEEFPNSTGESSYVIVSGNHLGESTSDSEEQISLSLNLVAKSEQFCFS